MLIDRKILSFLGPELLDEIEQNAIVREFPKGTEILREEQYIKGSANCPKGSDQSLLTI